MSVKLAQREMYLCVSELYRRVDHSDWGEILYYTWIEVLGYISLSTPFCNTMYSICPKPVIEEFVHFQCCN